METETRYLKISEVARRISVRPDTLRGWVEKGLVPVCRTVGGSLRIDERVIKDIVKAGVWTSRNVAKVTN